MIAFLFTPAGRVAAIAAIAILLISLGVWKIRADAQAEMATKAALDTLGRLDNAIRAGDAVDLGSAGLRKHDRNERD